MFAEELVEDFTGIGGAGGEDTLAGFGHLEKGADGAELGHVVGATEVKLNGLEGADDVDAKAGGKVGPDFLVAAIELGHEEGMAVFPAIEGGAIDAEKRADDIVGIADQEIVEGLELLGGKFVDSWWWGGVQGVKLGKQNRGFF